MTGPKNTGVVFDNHEFEEALDQWIRSGKAHTEIRHAAADSNKCIETLERVRRVDPSVLDEPVTM